MLFAVEQRCPVTQTSNHLHLHFHLQAVICIWRKRLLANQNGKK